MTTSSTTGRLPASLQDPGAVAALGLFREAGSLTRARVAELTGWARATVTSRLELLLGDGLLREAGSGPSGRGRPATSYELDRDRATLLVADVGASGMRLASCDLAGGVLHHLERDSRIGDGPETVLGKVHAGFDELLAQAPHPPVWGLAISLPGPVELATGRVVSPPIMTGWNNYDIVGEMSTWYDTVVDVENDVNAMALGEWARSGDSDLLVIKVGTGVGAGIISGGHLLRGAAGAAGDIGHTEADVVGIREDRPRCHCGRMACVEAYAGGWALVRDARAAGRDVDDVRGLMGLLEDGDPVVNGLVVDAGRILGASLATAVSVLNPARVILLGRIGIGAEELVAGVRERVYARALPLATRSLVIDSSTLGRDAGVIGLAHELAQRLLGGS